VLGIIHPHLVLADVRMPGLDGRTLCHLLATDPAYHALPRVLMSGVWDDLGPLPSVSAVLLKPVTASVLLATVQHYVQTSDSAQLEPTPGATAILTHV
jgi:CheY-like chemotaxis protein